MGSRSQGLSPGNISLLLPHPKSLSQVSQVGLAPLRPFWEFWEKGPGMRANLRNWDVPFSPEPSTIKYPL
jgi:hypothetical protein